MPKVSVIIPFYNSECYIGEAVQSVLNQSFTDHEIIAVDDGSTDGSPEIVKSFGKSIQYFHYPNGKSAAKMRNRGVSVSSGDYLAFLDSDDIWHPKKLESQVHVLDHSDHFGVVISDLELMEEDGTRNGSILTAYNPKEPFYRLFLKGFAILPSTIMMRKSVYEKSGGMEEEFSGSGLEDLEWAARVCEITDIEYLREPLTIYRQHLPRSPKYVEWENTSLFIQKLLDRFGYLPEQREYLIGRKIGNLSAIGKWKLQAGEIAEGRNCLWESISLSIQNRANSKVIIKSLLRIVRSYL